MTREPDRKRFDPRRVPPSGRFKQPRVYLVGEAPGAAEAACGEPFVGPAGKALDTMLEEAGCDRASMRLANAVPYRPITRSRNGKLQDRKPTAAEVEHYGGTVLTDIRRSKPAAIVALGATAAGLFGVSRPLKEARQEEFRFAGRPLRVTYHPAYVRRFGGHGSDLWRETVEDLRHAWRASA